MSVVTVESLVSVLATTEPIIRARYARKLSMIGGRLDIDDLCQMVALKAFRYIETCEAKDAEQLSYYILTIAKWEVEQALNSNRKCAKRSTTREQVAIGVATDASRDGYQPSVESDPAVAVEIKERCALMIDALKGLTAKQAQAVRMSYLEGAEYPVIAETMGISVNAARLLVSQGIKAARALVR